MGPGLGLWLNYAFVLSHESTATEYTYGGFTGWPRMDYGIPKYSRGAINMPLTVNGQTYYRTAEVCQMVGICRNTLFRWFKEGVSKDAQHRDRRGWRLFTQGEIDR